jgi:hypothetical protein
MPQGFGYTGPTQASARERRALDGLRTGRSGDDLAEAATAAVVKLSRAGGHPIAAPAPLHRRHGHRFGVGFVAVSALAVAILVGMFFLTGSGRRRR